jgi:hypothetical protein
VTPCSFVGKYQSAGGSSSFHLQDTTVNILPAASRCQIDKDTGGVMFLITGHSSSSSSSFFFFFFFFFFFQALNFL